MIQHDKDPSQNVCLERKKEMMKLQLYFLNNIPKTWEHYTSNCIQERKKKKKSIKCFNDIVWLATDVAQSLDMSFTEQWGCHTVSYTTESEIYFINKHKDKHSIHTCTNSDLPNQLFLEEQSLCSLFYELHEWSVNIYKKCREETINNAKTLVHMNINGTLYYTNMEIHIFKQLTYDTLCKWITFECCQSHITNLHRASSPCNEDIVTFQISVDDWWSSCMKIL